MFIARSSVWKAERLDRSVAPVPSPVTCCPFTNTTTLGPAGLAGAVTVVVALAEVGAAVVLVVALGLGGAVVVAVLVVDGDGACAVGGGVAVLAGELLS